MTLNVCLFVFSDCAPARCSRAAADDALAERLWEISCELLGIVWQWATGNHPGNKINYFLYKQDLWKALSSTFIDISKILQWHFGIVWPNLIESKSIMTFSILIYFYYCNTNQGFKTNISHTCMKFILALKCFYFLFCF